MLASLAVNGGLGIAKVISGIGQASKGRKLLASAKRPEYKIQDEYYDNRNLAARSAQTGYAQGSKDFFVDQADRGLTSGIDAVLQGGGTVNNISRLYDNYNQANRRFAAEDTQLRDAKLKSFLDANTALAGQETQKWAIDKYEPYKDTVRQANQMINGGTQNAWNGASTVASTASAAAVAAANDTSNPKPDTSGTTPSPSVLSTAVPSIIQSGYAVPGDINDPVNDPVMNSYIDSLIKKRYPNYNLA